jgi:hypothetical protein
MAFPRGTASPEFHGVFIPEGIDKRILYTSEFRIIVTYAMSLESLDRELHHILDRKGASVKEDARDNLRGKLDVVTSANKILHIGMDTCGGTPFVQLKYWVDF